MELAPVARPDPGPCEAFPSVSSDTIVSPDLVPPAEGPGQSPPVANDDAQGPWNARRPLLCPLATRVVSAIVSFVFPILLTRHVPWGEECPHLPPDRTQQNPFVGAQVIPRPLLSPTASLQRLQTMGVVCQPRRCSTVPL